MKAVLISIRPEWCAKIANGKKTVEVRRTKPKIPVPFKVYIYCTQGGDRLWLRDAAWRESWKNAPISFLCNAESCGGMSLGNGSVVGEFVCNRIDEIWKRGCPENFDYCYLSLNEWGNDDIASEINDVAAACLPKNQLNSYGAKVPRLYGWHISNLKIYDKPRELSRFVKPYDAKACPKPTVIECGDCTKCYLKRAPQSWCYVEDNGNDKT